MTDILYDSADHVATITFNRPETRNAFTVDMFTELGDLLRKGAAEARCIVITGTGDAFSSGLDLTEAAAKADQLDSLAFTFDTNRSAAIALQEIDVPVVAAVNGPAAGYAVGIAINADIRVMSRTARFVPATKRNLLPESGDTWLLPRLVGWEQAARFYFLGDDLGAEDALAAGVAQIAAMPPNAVQAAKRLMRHGRSDAYPDHVHRALLQLIPMFRTRDFAEAMAAFFERRDPEFTGE